MSLDPLAAVGSLQMSLDPLAALCSLQMSPDPFIPLGFLHRIQEPLYPRYSAGLGMSEGMRVHINNYIYTVHCPFDSVIL